MNLVSAVCPSCGAQIQIPPDQDRAFCSYCGNQIVVKTEIADKVKIDGVVKIQSADFIIEAGALKEYHGAGTDVVIPDNVTNISGAFRKTSITTITLPDVYKRQALWLYTERGTTSASVSPHDQTGGSGLAPSYVRPVSIIQSTASPERKHASRIISWFPRPCDQRSIWFANASPVSPA